MCCVWLNIAINESVTSELERFKLEHYEQGEHAMFFAQKAIYYATILQEQYQHHIAPNEFQLMQIRQAWLANHMHQQEQEQQRRQRQQQPPQQQPPPQDPQ